MTKAAASPGATPHGATSQATDLEAADFRLVHRLRVRWAEADLQGVVFNAHYLAWFDIAITEYWRALANGDRVWLIQTWERFYVVKSTLDYRQPARFDDEIDVAVRTSRLGRSSMDCMFEVRRDTDLLVTGASVYVHTIEGKAAPLPDDLRARILRYEKTTAFAHPSWRGR